MKNHYEILQVFPNATAADIKNAFRFLLFRYHPDHNKGKEEWAVQQTMALVEAYHILSDPARRVHYDAVRGMKLRDDPPAKKGLFAKEKPGAAEAREHFKRGQDAFKADEAEQAIMAFRKVLELEPDHPAARYNLAVCLFAIERLPEAQQWLQDQVARNKDDQESRALFTKIGGLQSKLRQARGAAAG